MKIVFFLVVMVFSLNGYTKEVETPCEAMNGNISKTQNLTKIKTSQSKRTVKQ